MTPSKVRFSAGASGPKVTGWVDWLVESRVHHWTKNTLVFVPLALTPELLSTESVIQTMLGFLVLSIACSGSYLLNDWFDRAADRQHWSKCRRPVASGRIAGSSALAGAAGLCALGMLLAMALNAGFAAFLAGYLFLSLAYSYYLKTLALLDLVVLAAMFTLRIAMGVALIDGTFSAWLPVFVFLFFGGLSTAKRAAELVVRTKRQDHSDNRRGYRDEDLPLLIALGISFTIGALIVLAVFIPAAAVPEATYASPQRLWFALPFLLVWTLRIWVFAVRGILTDDPVLFSLRDRFSMVVGLLLGATVVSLHLP